MGLGDPRLVGLKGPGYRFFSPCTWLWKESAATEMEGFLLMKKIWEKLQKGVGGLIQTNSTYGILWDAKVGWLVPLKGGELKIY